MGRDKWLSYDSVAKICERTGFPLVKKLGKTETVIKIEKISAKDDILTTKTKKCTYIQ